MDSEFLKQSSLIAYSKDLYKRENITDISQFELRNDDDINRWYNTYGLDYPQEFSQVVHENHLDDFLIRLVEDKEQSNKLIELDDLIFLSIKILRSCDEEIDSEQMFFICSHKYIWSIQERSGDYFGWIRERLKHDEGIIRKKNTDYLLFLLLESVIDNYKEISDRLIKTVNEVSYVDIDPSPEFAQEVEKRKNLFYELKKATMSFRDLLVKFEKVDLEAFQQKYFGELREQATNLISEIDFAIQDLDSQMNLIFSMQGYRLNEIMKTLTILSAIFIPLTFLAGIYGMNFANMPELTFKYGYFILWGLMLVIAGICIIIFYRRGWF